MSITDTLLQTAAADTELLRKNDALGDVFSLPRDVDFYIRTPTREKADLIASFINDNQYGTARVDSGGDTIGVLVKINMPIQQHIVCCVSALMACVAALFGGDYDGWGCEIQRGT